MLPVSLTPKASPFQDYNAGLVPVILGGQVNAQTAFAATIQRLTPTIDGSVYPGYSTAGTGCADGCPQMENQGIVRTTVQKMLLTADNPGHGKKIYVLPAWPQGRDVSFKLHAPLQTTVELEYKAGKIGRLVVTPAARKGDVVLPSFLSGRTALKVDDVSGVASSSPSSTAFWRNDSANLALTASWNRYYDATPFSFDVTSPNISDTPPFSLDWSMGKDGPLGWKDGHGCLFGGRYFAIAGGVMTHVWSGPGGPGIEAEEEADIRTTIVYDTLTDTWDAKMIGPMPYTPLRTTGACGTDALFILSGEGSNAVFGGGAASRQVAMLRMEAGPKFVWSLLPELPVGAGRWLAAAAVLNDHLVLTGGTNTPGIELSIGRSAEETEHLRRRILATGGGPDSAAGPSPPASGCDAVTAKDSNSTPGGGVYPRCIIENLTPCDCPPRLPSFKLFLGNASSPPSKAWSTIAPFPEKGYDVPNFVSLGDSLYIFGGWRANARGQRAWQMDPDSLYQLAAAQNLPVPITIGTNGAELLRTAWKYSIATDAWERLPDMPLHMCLGSTVVLNSRYIVQLGSAHGKNSFRVGSNDPRVRSMKGLVGTRGMQGLIP